ncbi:alpha/beta fold hydrolase [Candidatus Clostridium helianthi]|uniref:Alpha/beta fold hydrolase n=1 Tax=Candidatus Clostridium helianthi TaxID=3381660 RepID=A0ABW8S7A4_9CLOT
MSGGLIGSYWGVNLESKVISQSSTTLAVLMPGIGYTLDRPLLDYSKKLALELGYDVLSLEYGFQIARKNLLVEKELKHLINESICIFKSALKGNYTKIVFISKSIGTIVHTLLCDEISGYEVKHIYLTPIDNTLKVGIKEKSLVITGTDDPLINKESIEEIKRINGVEMIEIEGADHSLNISNDILRSIDVIHKVIEAEKKYLI